jgi:protein involved in polysaccharide export with SLBB domain
MVQLSVPRLGGSITVRALVAGGAFCVLSLAGALVPAPLAAQQSVAATDTAAMRRLVEQQVGRTVTQGEILDRIRESGLSRAAMREQLRQQGYDPAIADIYYDQLEGVTPGQGAGGGSQGAGSVAPGDTARVAAGAHATEAVSRLAAVADSAVAEELPVFGRALFERETNQFEPLLSGPASPDYRLGRDDEIILVLTGDTEAFQRLRVAPEGYIVVPRVGQVYVNGLTLRELEAQLYQRLSRAYSGLGRGAEATTHLSISLGDLRVNQVYLIGEVERPSAYSLSAAGTVFDALYQAGGPNENDSFRRIQVHRGGKLVQTVDLYDYLLHGDSRADIRLEHGDIIFVPQYSAQVRLEGRVRRPAIYEVLPTESLTDLLGYAGGLQAEALARRVQVDRILPPEKRRPGLDRVLIDVGLDQLGATGDEGVLLRDGDIVRVFTVTDERRHRVVITGQVRHPGVYEWADGLTLWDLIERADGLADQAYTPRGHIYRLNERDGNRTLIQSPLLADSTGRPLQDVMLADRDSIVIFGRSELRIAELVTIAGYVKQPGTYLLAEGMSVPDLILTAGGFAPGADRLEAEVARKPEELRRTTRTARIYRVPLVRGDSAAELKASGAVSPAGVEAAASALPVWLPAGEEFALRHGDQVFIRKAPGYDQPRTVQVTGQVLVPGTYVLETRQERLLDLLERVGGLTDEAYTAGFQLFREGSPLSVDLERAVKRPEGRFNVVLQAGDSLHFAEYDPTVLVTGAVTFESRVLYEPGKGLDYYINRAGGYNDVADRGRVVVAYQDGAREAVDKFLFFKSKPTPGPGSRIFVPEKPLSARGGTSWADILLRSTTVMSSILTVIIAVKSLD